MTLLYTGIYFELAFFATIVIIILNFSSIFRWLMRHAGRWYGNKFNKSSQSQPKEETLSPYSFSFQSKDGRYPQGVSGQDERCQYNIPNPFRGILVVGGAGSGKSETFANSLIWQAVAKNYSGILYDFKYPSLTRQLVTAARYYNPETKPENATTATTLNSNSTQKKPKLTIATINFEDLRYTHRVNPLHPRYIKSISHAEEYATAIINNLMPESIAKTDFWVRSSIAILQAAIWYFKEEHKDLCDLPHIVSFIQSPPSVFLKRMRQNELCEKLLSSVLTAHDQKAENQLAGTIGTLQLALNKISTPEISYVLSADEFSLDINNPTAPTFLSLANTPTLMDTFGPVLSLIATVSLKMMNQEDKQHSIVILDEAPTIYIPKLETVPATGRSRKIAVVFMCQDFSQITDKYGQTKKETIVSNLANQFYGRVSNVQTAEYVSKIFGRKDTLMKSRSFNEGTGDSNSGASKSGGSSSSNQGESISYSYQEREVLKPQAVFGFTQGRFASMIAERPVHLSALFIGDYERFEAPVSLDELPEIRPDLDVIALHRQINADIKAMLDGLVLPKQNLDQLSPHKGVQVPQSGLAEQPKLIDKPKLMPITGTEHTCATADFKTVLQSIALTQTAITEMQVRYIFDNNTIPVSTYDFVPQHKQPGENWAGYCTRTINEATTNFNAIISSGEIEKNAIKKYQVLQEKQNAGVAISEHLRFILFLDRTGTPNPN